MDHSGLVGASAEAATYCVGQARPITNSWDSSSPLPLPAVPATRPYLSALWVGTTLAHSVRSEQHHPACCYETRLPLDISLGHLHNQTHTLQNVNSEHNLELSFALVFELPPTSIYVSSKVFVCLT